MERKRPGIWDYFMARFKGDIVVRDLNEDNYAHPECSVSCRRRGSDVEGRGNNGYAAYLAMFKVLAG
jgi:hypothetical protein